MRVLVTGSSGLVGSECVRHFDRRGHKVHGIDNNQRREFFGLDGDTGITLKSLLSETDFAYYGADIRNRDIISEIFEECKPHLVIHCAAQPSHDWAAQHPVEDFEINAVGTLNLLEATRQHAPSATFIFASTNKVYGDAPNRIEYRELPTRWEMSDDWFDENLTIDQSRHSLFGASKLAADILVQEYGQAYGIPTACFRCGCLTGSAHAAAEQHGFLAYLVKCAKEGRKYKIYGYKGKQVRDNLHAADVAAAFAAFAADPKIGAVYILGGGRANSCSILEAIAAIESLLQTKIDWEYVDQPRAGDHICYITNTAKFRGEYNWSVTRSLDDIIAELCGIGIDTKAAVT